MAFRQPKRVGYGTSAKGDLVLFLGNRVVVMRPRGERSPDGPRAWVISGETQAWRGCASNDWFSFRKARQEVRDRSRYLRRNGVPEDRLEAEMHAGVRALKRFLDDVRAVEGPGMIADLCRYKDGSWRMYDLYCRVPELRELARTNRALAFAIAHHWRFTGRKPRRPVDAVRRLARMRRKDALAEVGFPGKETLVRTLSRFGDGAVTLERLLRLRAALANDSRIPARLAHLPRLEDGLLAVASSRLLRFVSNRALLDLAAMPAVSRSKPKTLGLLIDTVRMMLRLGRDDILFCRWSDVRETHDDLAERFVILATSYENEPFELDGLPAGIDAHGIRIEPIVDTDDLAREAAAMRNCLASPNYAEGAIKGRSGFYRMLLPERASIQVSREPPGDHWVVREMMGEDNDWVGRDAIRAAEKWLCHENRRLGLAQLELDFEPRRGWWLDLATRAVIEKYGLEYGEPDAPYEHTPVLMPQVIELLSPHG